MSWKLIKWCKVFATVVLVFTWQVGTSQSSPSKIMVVSPPPDIQNWVGKKLPIFALHDLNGKAYNNESINGKVTVINLWSTTCHPCIDEMPLLSKLVDKYDNQNVIFLAPAPEAIDKINLVLTHQSFAYTVLPKAQDLFKSFNLPGYPYHIIVDRGGFIRFIRTGTMNPKTGQKIAEADLPTAIEQELR